MKALNVLLAVLVSALIGLAVLEVGLRFLVVSPEPKLLEFDAHTGWRKRASFVAHRSGREFSVTIRTNEYGLADDPLGSPLKPAGRFRVLVLGDSFTQGFTVDRKDLYVDLLEQRWKAEGRDVDVINAGTQAWSTDQEVEWLRRNGEQFQPDLVVLAAYENDIYWNGSPTYEQRDTPKPRFDADGELASGELRDLGPRPWTDDWATSLLAKSLVRRANPDYYFRPEGAASPVSREFAPLFVREPEFLAASIDGTRGALRALERSCRQLGAAAFVVPIPSHSAIDPDYRASFAATRLGGVADEAWSPDKPVDTFLALAREVGLPTLDPRPALRAASAAGESLYFDVDWHLNPAGNRVLASFLHDELDRVQAFPASHRARSEAPAAAIEHPAPRWPYVFAALWLALSALYIGNYPKERKALVPLEVGGLLALVFAIVLGGGKLVRLLPPAYASYVAVLFVVGVLGFVAYKLGRRIGIIAELLKAFVLRGHWYLMPLLVVLLTVGSLLVVAASSPLIAPFIYTLF